MPVVDDAAIVIDEPLTPLGVSVVVVMLSSR